MDAGNWPNLAAMFFAQAQRFRERPFLWAKRQGAYAPLSWGDVAARVTPLARGLLAQGVEPGDRVALVSENRPAWLVADVAIMSIGAVTVPAYTTNTEADHLHILGNSGAKGAIVSARRLAEPLIRAAHAAGTVKFVAAIDPPEASQRAGVEVLHLDRVIERGRALPDNVGALAERWRRDDTACIIYTSGTGGAPKGVMLPHRAILHNCAGARAAFRDLGLEREVFLSFLPLSHSYEHTAGQFFPISIGAEIYYAEGAETLAANMLEARPTIMTAVPRLYETLHQRISLGVRKSGALKRRLFEKTLELGRRRRDSPDGLALSERLLDGLLERLVRDRVRARFGGRLKALVSGGAPLNPDIAAFFAALGVRILQGYGQTEAAPVISCNRAAGVKFHTVGPPLDGVEVRIATDGEILVQGPLLMQGYWRNEAATREAIRDGWLHTGDIGLVDGDGHLVITDRKKDIIVLSGGDNVSPQRIEGFLTLEPEIAQAMVHGDRRPHLVALLVPDAEWAQAWAEASGKPAEPDRLARDEDLRKALAQAVERVNARLSPLEKVRRFQLAEAPFTVENQQLTPTLKPRRHKIREAYGAALDALYA